MIEVGVRELKAGISGYLRRVAAGERIRVTLHGRPVADLIPSGRGADDARWDELVAEGKITPAQRPWRRGAFAPRRGTGSASAHVLAEREADR
jgi:prevent-host-death family protein